MNKILIALFLFSIGTFASSGQETPSQKPLLDLDIDYMLPGYFFAPPKIANKDALTESVNSRNSPKAIEPNLNPPQDKVSLIALPDEEIVFFGKYKGIKVLLVNARDEQVRFSSSDRRLNIVQEALDSDGQWKPVEYLPPSWCGNSFQIVFLDAHGYWEFAAARFTGKFKTKLRFRLDGLMSTTRNGVIYSNEFEGSINKTQFTDKRPS